jgi:hypothetical protein
MATKKRTKKSSVVKPSKRRKTTKRGKKAGRDVHALVGLAISDAKFLEKLLANPERTLASFDLDAATKKDVLATLASPAKVNKAITAFRVRLGRPSVETV